MSTNRFQIRILLAEPSAARPSMLSGLPERELSNWKGLASANTALGCTPATLLAKRGITGPMEVLEGKNGFMESVAGRFEIDWSLERLDSRELRLREAIAAGKRSKQVGLLGSKADT